MAEEDPQVVTVTASATSYDDGSGDLNIYDDEQQYLSIAVWDEIREGGGTVTGTVFRWADDTSEALTVSLSVSESNQLSLPSSITIPAGEDSADFDFEAIADDEEEGTTTVTITVSADNFSSGSADVTINDSGITLEIEAFTDSVLEDGDTEDMDSC